MKYVRLVRVLVSVVLSMVFVAIPVGYVHAMPFNAAVNFATGGVPFSIAVGDFNRDGNPDLAVANSASGNVSILLGNGLGAFALAVNYTVGLAPQSVAVGDFNRDGNPDLAVANAGSDNVSILMGNGLGAFVPAVNYAVGTNPWSVAVGDFNRDGNPDLATANNGGNDVSILMGNGLGAFAGPVNYVVLAGPHYVAVGDFNRDGNPDLATANITSNNISILLGNGLGAFGLQVDYTAGTTPNTVAVGDFNRDGNPDLAVVNLGSNDVSILLGNGLGAFGLPVNYAAGTNPRFVAVGDFNLDGIPDLAVADIGSNNISILLGNGTGAFAALVNYAVGINPIYDAVGDFNRDGTPDLAVANANGANVSILLNMPELPTITAVNPASGLQGQTLTVIITGTKFAGPTTVNFGAGITVNSITVNNLTQITANISIAGAAPGARNVSVTTPGGTAMLTGGFTVIRLITSTGPGSHSSTVSAPTTPAPPVSLPNIIVQSASLSAKSVTPGTPVTVTADISNKSTVNGNKKVTLYINGQVETEQGVVVNSGGTSKLTFDVSLSEPGDYSVYVDGVPAGSFKVELFRESDAILIFSAVLVALAFLIGMVLLWRRQRRTA